MPKYHPETLLQKRKKYILKIIRKLPNGKFIECTTISPQYRINNIVKNVSDKVDYNVLDYEYNVIHDEYSINRIKKNVDKILFFLEKKYPSFFSAEQLKEMGVCDQTTENIGRTLRYLCKCKLVSKIKIKNVKGRFYIYNKRLDKNKKKY